MILMNIGIEGVRGNLLRKKLLLSVKFSGGFKSFLTRRGRVLGQKGERDVPLVRVPFSPPPVPDRVSKHQSRKNSLS